MSAQPRKSTRALLPTQRFTFPPSHRTTATLTKECKERSRVRIAVRNCRGMPAPPANLHQRVNRKKSKEVGIDQEGLAKEGVDKEAEGINNEVEIEEEDQIEESEKIDDDEEWTEQRVTPGRTLRPRTLVVKMSWNKKK